MGAGRGIMLARPIRERCWLLAPTSLELFVTQSGEGLSHVCGISTLAPGHNQCAGRKRQRFIDREATSIVLWTDLPVGLQKDTPGYLGLGRVRPVFRQGG